MPRVSVKQAAKKQGQVYGVSPNTNSMSFQERLMQRFAAHEYVTVRNVDDERFTWQYLPAHEEEFEFTTDPAKITHRGDPEIWYLAPGKEETIVGANAYIMIEGLYKILVAKKRTDEEPDKPHGLARNFNFGDADQQEYWIDQILVGKATPTFGGKVKPVAPTTPQHPQPVTNPVGPS